MSARRPVQPPSIDQRGSPVLPSLLRRTAVTLVRIPALAASPVLMSAFFLLVYTGQLGRAGAGLLPDGTYLEFILPLVLLTTAFSGGALAGQLLVRDMTTGYHDRLLLTGAGRIRLVGAPLIAGTAVLVLQATLLVAISLALGLRALDGGQLLALIVGTSVAGTAFALLGAAAAVWSRSDAAVNATVLLFFPLSFLTSAFAPREELTGWMRGAATVNPLTYVLEGLRAAAGGVAPPDALLVGIGVLAVVAAAGAAACVAAFHRVETAR